MLVRITLPYHMRSVLAQHFLTLHIFFHYISYKIYSYIFLDLPPQLEFFIHIILTYTLRFINDSLPLYSYMIKLSLYLFKTHNIYETPKEKAASKI